MQSTSVVYAPIPEPISNVCQVEGVQKFLLQAHQSIGKRVPLCTASVKLLIRRNAKDELTFPVSIKWFRIHTQRTLELKEHEDKAEYHFSTLDVGSSIKAVVKPFDQSYGSAHLDFGVIKFDPELRPQLENVLLSRVSKYNATLLTSTATSSIHPSNPLMNLLVSNNHIMLSHLHLKVKDVYSQQYACEILNGEPKFETPASEDPRDLTVYIKDLVESPTNYHSNPPYERSMYDYQEQYKLKLRFTSRTLKDVFVASVRLVRTVNQMSLNELFRNIDRLIESGR